ncbi:MAG: LamG-like jellyroll fold domain-containing protein [Verrucomicrobiia bacterium]
MITFMDGFDHYTTNAQLLHKWSGTSPGTLVPSAGAARYSGQGVALAANQVIYSAVRGAPASTMTIGLALYRTSASAQGYIGLCETVSNDPSIRVRVKTDGNVQVENWSGTAWVQLGVTTTAPVAASTWYYVTIVVNYASTTSGYVHVLVNTTRVLALDSVITRTSGSLTTLGAFAFYNEAGQSYIDDVYVSNTAVLYGSGTNLPCRIVTMLPTGAGDLTQLALYGAATNWQAVASQTPPTIGTKYVSGLSHGIKDLYTLGPAISTGTYIFAVNVLLYGSNAAASFAAFAPVVKCGGTSPGTFYGEALPLTASPAYRQKIWTTNPAGSSASYGGWTPAEVNAMQAGLMVYNAATPALPAGAKTIYLPAALLEATPGKAYSVRVTAIAPTGTLARDAAGVCTAVTIDDGGVAFAHQFVIEVLRWTGP